MHLTCAAAAPPVAATSFASKGSGWLDKSASGPVSFRCGQLPPGMSVSAVRVAGQRAASSGSPGWAVLFRPRAARRRCRPPGPGAGQDRIRRRVYVPLWIRRREPCRHCGSATSGVRSCRSARQRATRRPRLRWDRGRVESVHHVGSQRRAVGVRRLRAAVDMHRHGQISTAGVRGTSAGPLTAVSQTGKTAPDRRPWRTPGGS